MIFKHLSLILSVFCLLIAPAVLGQEKINTIFVPLNWKEANLKGKVKSVKEKGGSLKENFVGAAYNPKNYTYQAAQKLHFDQQGMLTHKEDFYEYEANKIFRETFYKYNAQNQIIEVSIPKEKTKTFFEYNNGNLLKKRECLFIENKCEMEHIVNYTTKENVIEKTQNSPENNLIRKDIYIYNTNKQLISYNHTLTIKRGEASYNSYAKVTYEYNQKGNLIKKITSESSNWDVTKIYKYDDSHNIIEEKSFNPAGEILTDIKYIYKFDNQGNWTHKYSTEYDQPNWIWVRKIEYY